MSDTYRALENWAQGSAQTLSALLSQEVQLESPAETKDLNPREFETYLGVSFCLPFTLSGPAAGPMVLAIEEPDALRLASLMLGEESPAATLSKLHLEILTEACQQMVSGLPESLYESVGLDGTTVSEGTPSHGPLVGLGAEKYQAFRLDFSSDEEAYPFHLLVPSVLAEKLAEAFTSKPTKSTSSTNSTSAGSPAVKAEFQPFSTMTERSTASELDLILDVPMQVTAVLGNTSVSMEDLINLGKGSVLELDKLAGEPVELFVHGRQIGIGEVVVIDERFGVKILEISSGRHSARSNNSIPQVL